MGDNLQISCFFDFLDLNILDSSPNFSFLFPASLVLPKLIFSLFPCSSVESRLLIFSFVISYSCFGFLRLSTKYSTDISISRATTPITNDTNATVAVSWLFDRILDKSDLIFFKTPFFEVISALEFIIII
ncbi:hypothetical protein AYI70_g1746 [Smittium culicis]|uniref:Uncharacterized protein n=1 Tax=Smittium culicis TaxID=133412 RepID=A0A1R1YBJ3_9FUNG|nr:hypothetical protein AYI70_g1746 [Smittium culicis]